MRRKEYFILAVAIAALFVCAQVAHASEYSGAWVQTDQNNFFVISAGLSSGYGFGMYDGDSSNIDFSNNGLITDDGLQSVQVAVVPVSSGYEADCTYFGGSTKAIPLGTTPRFYFYFANLDDTPTYYTSYQMQGSKDNWILTNINLLYGSDPWPVSVSDASPVPLSTSAVFLLSGLLGLVAFGSRRKLMK